MNLHIRLFLKIFLLLAVHKRLFLGIQNGEIHMKFQVELSKHILLLKMEFENIIQIKGFLYVGSIYLKFNLYVV